MRIFVAFDDTDTLDCGRGTGKLARWFTGKLPQECHPLGVVRQQLLFSEDIPMTSHNSSLCVIVDAPDSTYTSSLAELAAIHIMDHFVDGSDPGLCVVSADNPVIYNLARFGQRCTYEKVTLEEAIEVASGCHLSGHGGTNMGMIGAVAAAGLTWKGDSGRFVDFGNVRDLPEVTTVKQLTDMGIHVFSVNRHGDIPAPRDMVDNFGSLRPLLFSGRVVLPVVAAARGRWKIIIDKITGEE